MRNLLIFLSAVLGVLGVAAVPLRAQDPNFDLNRISQATVYILQTRSFLDNDVTCVGTGTIVSRDGLILTNAHNTVTNPDCPGEALLIALTRTPGEPPILQYRAEVAQANPGLDLALLRITSDLDGRLLDTNLLSLSFVELADSAFVSLDATISIVGYPGAGNEPLEVRRGTISGFVAEPSAGDRAWFKTDAVIPGTMTGGGVYNQEGQLIGIPTTAPVRSLIADTTCLNLQDTNDDGLVNQADSCVPVGGFINAIRPSNFARSLLRGASIGLTVDVLTAPAFSLESSRDTQEPSFFNLFFTTAVNEGMPVSVVNSLPTGTTSLYLFFDYANMTPETVYELRVTTDNIPNPTFSLAPVRWSGGSRGLWYIGHSEQVWPNGVYEFSLFINGIANGRSTIVIGGSPQLTPTFSSLFFGLLDQDTGQLFGNGFVLGTGSIVTATFLYNNMPAQTPWVAIWYYNDAEIQYIEDVWTRDTDGRGDTSIVSDVLLPGRYRLALYIDGRLAALSDFIVAGARDAAFSRVFTEARFVAADRAEEAIQAAAIRTLPNARTDVFALFNWEQLAPGTLWTMRWSVDDEVFYEQTAPWQNSEAGEAFLVRMTGSPGIPDGRYRMEVFIGTVRLVDIEIEVGIGQLPIDVFASASGVQLQGRIIDANSGEGIPQVTFILISEDFSVEDFIWDRSQVYAVAVTDQSGRFQIDRLLQFEAPYSVIVAADGYLPINADGFVVDADTPNPLDIVIPLTRD